MINVKKSAAYLFFIFLATVSFCQPVKSQTLNLQENKQHPFADEKNTGFFNLTTFSPLSFSGQYLNGIQTICGDKLNPHLLLGGGMGLERLNSLTTYDNIPANLTLLPVFADIRYVILKKKISPVIALDGGYKFLLNNYSSSFIYESDVIFPGVAWDDYYDNDTYKQGGFFLTAEAGIKMNIYKRLIIYGSVDYSLWSVSGDHHHWIYDYKVNSDNQTILKETEITSRTLAYTHIFLIRLGFGF